MTNQNIPGMTLENEQKPEMIRRVKKRVSLTPESEKKIKKQGRKIHGELIASHTPPEG